MKIYDCHIHSEHSIDANNTIDDICKAAIDIGATAITITDHSLPQPDGCTAYEHIRKSFFDTKSASEKYEGKLLVLSGVERDDEYPPSFRESFYDLDFDCILGSAHSEPTFKFNFSDTPYRSLKKCASVIPMEILKDFVVKYYERLASLAYYADVDVITHLTFPFRYINGISKRNLDESYFYPHMDEVLKGVIETKKALEVNTSGKLLSWNKFMPDENILRRYYQLGGRIITLGSDAHKKENIAAYFFEAQEMLKSIGFTHGSYYIKRKRYKYEL